MFLPSLVIALLIAVAVGINVFLQHVHNVRVQEFRASYGHIFRLAQLILIVVWVLVTFFIVLISRLTIFTTISVYGLFLGTGALVIVLSVMSGFEQASAILVANRAVLERSARALLERETLEEADLDALTGDLQKPVVRQELRPDETMAGVK